MAGLLETEYSCTQLSRAIQWERWASMSQWAEARIVLPDKTTAPGPLDLSLTPYARALLNCLTNPWTSHLTIIAGSQMFKTLLEIILICYIIDQRPTNALFLMPREQDAEEIAVERVKPVILASPHLAKYVKNAERQITKAKISLNGATIFFASAGVPAELAQRSIEFGVADETHLYKDSLTDEGAVLDLLAARLSNYPGSIMIDTSTPTDNQAISWDQYNKGTKHVWKEPCPHCGKFNVLNVDNIKCDEGYVSPQQIQSDLLAWYECPECEARIEEHEKHAMLAKGKWFTDFPSAHPSHYSFHISGISSPWRSFSGVLCGKLESSGDPEKFRSFKNTVCGENYTEKRSEMDARAVKIASDDDGSLLRGQIPDNAVMFTIGCDWHGARNGLFWTACAWVPGPEVYVVDYGNVFSEEELLQQTLGRDWRTVSNRKVMPKIGVDSGWEPADVYEFVRPHYPHTRPTKGDDAHLSRASALRESPVDYTVKKSGKRYTGFNRLHINTEYFKDRLAGMLKAIFRHHKKDEEVVNDDGGSTPADEYKARFHLCRNADDQFIDQLSNEHKVRIKKVMQWTPKYNGAPNHYLDCFIVAWAVAELHGFARISRKVLEKREGKKTAGQKVDRHKKKWASGGRWNTKGRGGWLK